MISDHPVVFNTTILGLGGGLGFNSVPIDNGTSIMGALGTLDRLFVDTKEVLHSTSDLNSMQL